jgi:hypothetical protein
MMKTLASLRSDSWTTSAGSGGHLPPDYPDNFTGLRRRSASEDMQKKYEKKAGAD